MTKQIKADLSLLAITAIWGSSFALMKNVLDYMPSFAYLALRFLIAAAVMVAIFHREFRNLNKKVLLYGCILGLMLFGGMALQVTGLYFTTASNSAFITGLNVIMVPVISALVLRKKPDIASVIGVILAFAGLFFLTGGLDFRFNIGDFLTLLCALCFALQIIFIDKFTGDQDASLLAVLQIGFAALLYTAVWLFLDFEPIEFKMPVVTTLLITGVLGTALAFTVQTLVQRMTSPTHTALILTAEPVFGAVFALLIPNSVGVTETLKMSTIAGCALILFGMLVCELKPGMRNMPNP
jgi:drug/metabolite transporter (DMT)-like permease